MLQTVGISASAHRVALPPGSGFANYQIGVQHSCCADAHTLVWNIGEWNTGQRFAVHEMSIAESVLQIIEDKARADGYARVRAVWLEIGQLAAVEKDSLRFCFDVVTRDSVARDARLEIIETAGQGWCMDCACNVAVTARYEPCPNCGSFQIEVTGGDEMRVKELEVE
jgi:hydrogenase nickel incorporation protein HypA/HybF